jgi:hypothetical protein
MKNLLILVALFVTTSCLSQTCSQLTSTVAVNGACIKTCVSPSSTSIDRVDFYQYDGDYYALVTFRGSWTRYIYQVPYSSISNYGANYVTSAGKAFHAFIASQDRLGCN